MGAAGSCAAAYSAAFDGGVATRLQQAVLLDDEAGYSRKVTVSSDIVSVIADVVVVVVASELMKENAASRSATSASRRDRAVSGMPVRS